MEQGNGGRDIAVVRIIIGSAVGVAVLHLYASFDPSGGNWGFHHPGFLPVSLKIGLPALMAIAALAPVQKLLLHLAALFTRITGGLGTRRRRIFIALLVLLAGTLFWAGRERLFFLGDGFLLARLVPHINSAHNPQFFLNEPLPSYLDGRMWHLLNALGILPSDAFAIQLLNILAGAASLLVTIRLAQSLANDPLDRLLAFAFVVVSGTSQLFFGYVENYTLLLLGLLFFLASALSYLHNRVPFVLPSIALGVLITIHVGMVVMLPAYALIVYQAWHRGRPASVFGGVAAGAAVALSILLMCGITPGMEAGLFLNGGSHLLPLIHRAGGADPYPMFSLPHLADLLNLILLLSPSAPFLLAAALTVGGHPRGSRRFQRSFVLVVALCGLAFIALSNFELGMSRDWDLTAAFGLGIVVAAAGEWTASPIGIDLRRRAMIVAIAATLIHSAGWIAVNGAEESSLARFRTLPDDRFWSGKAMAAACEELGIFYRGRENPKEALEWLKKSLAYDSTNDRIMASVANIYRLDGDKENEQRYDELAVGRGTRFWDVYVNLGSIYATQGRTREALHMTMHGLELNPDAASANNNAGSLLLREGSDCRHALPFFLHAIEADPSYAEAYYNAALCYFQLGEFRPMRAALEDYLRLRPDQGETPEVRALLEMRHRHRRAE